MKFVLESVTKNSGALTNIEKFPGKTLETPFLLLHTRGCQLPHISKEVFNLSFPDVNQVLEINLSNTHHFEEAVKQSKLSISEFSGMPEFLSFVILKDPSQLCPSGFHEKDMVPFFSKSGKVTITAEKYMDIIEVFRPDFYTILSDSDTSLNPDCPKKRIIKSAERSLQFFKDCIARHKKSESLSRNSKLTVSLVGGSNLKERENFYKEVQKHESEIFGYFIDGCHNNGSTSYSLDQNALKEVVEHSLKLTPDDKIKIMLGCYSPLAIVELVKMGIDIFDTSIAHLMTRNNKAFVFKWDGKEENSKIPFLDLSDETFKNDFTPIMDNCGCLTCTKSTRAYINHLITVKELLGPIYLMIHNVHHYLEFFKEIRNCIKTDSLPLLLENLSKYQWESLKLSDKIDSEDKGKPESKNEKKK